MPARQVLSRTRCGWSAVLHAAFLLLCLRYLAAAASTGLSYASGWATVVVIAGGLTLGVWNRRAALFVFLAAVPLLNGLGYVGLSDIPSVVSLVFAAVFIGISVRRAGALMVVLGRTGRIAASTRPPRSSLMVVADVFATAVLASLTWQILRHCGAPAFWTRFWCQPVFGYGDPLYFLTAAFIWLQGLFFFRELCREEDGLRRWMRPVAAAYAASVAVFVVIQLRYVVPVHTGTGNAFSSPFEDIHAFGSIVVTGFVFSLAAWPGRRPARQAAHALQALAFLLFVILSWSRATWLAALASLLLLAALRLPKRVVVALLAVCATGVIAINVASRGTAWRRSAYLERLASLVRIEDVAHKIPERMNLYHKAFAMIRLRPWFGFGIGSFYLHSRAFARPGDPEASRPDFAHDFLLQLSAELGVPVALLFAALIGDALWRGYRGGDERRLRQGIALALTAYVMTQLTANALNIYISQQFLFWYLMAALLTAGEPAACSPAHGDHRLSQPPDRTGDFALSEPGHFCSVADSP